MRLSSPVRRPISLAVGGHELHAALYALGLRAHNWERREGGREGGNEEKKKVKFNKGDLSKQIESKKLQVLSSKFCLNMTITRYQSDRLT